MNEQTLKLPARPMQLRKEQIRVHPELFTPAQRELLEFMDAYKVDRRRLSSLTGYSITTVNSWFYLPQSNGYRGLSRRKLDMVKAQVRDKLLYSASRVF